MVVDSAEYNLFVEVRIKVVRARGKQLCPAVAVRDGRESMHWQPVYVIYTSRNRVFYNVRLDMKLMGP